MSRMPRILPLVAIAIGGVLAVKVISGAPQLLSATKAFAEDTGLAKDDKAAPATSPPGLNPASTGGVPVAPKAAPIACAPTAAELAKEAGLSPAELQVLQSLSNRRGELDQRASDLDTQVQLIAAAQAKVDARIQEMNQLKSDIQGLLGQADQQAQAETDSLVRVYEAMKPKDAAARMTLLDDSVRLPLAAKMKERSLSAVLSFMSPEDAKSLTEKLAQRVSGAAAVANAQAALNPPQTPAAPPAEAAQAPDDQAAAKPKRKAVAKAHAKPVQTAHAAAPRPAASHPAAAAEPDYPNVPVAGG